MRQQRWWLAVGWRAANQLFWAWGVRIHRQTTDSVRFFAMYPLHMDCWTLTHTTIIDITAVQQSMGLKACTHTGVQVILMTLEPQLKFVIGCNVLATVRTSIELQVLAQLVSPCRLIILPKILIRILMSLESLERWRDTASDVDHLKQLKPV